MTEAATSCKIDHAAAGSVPSDLCRACNPLPPTGIGGWLLPVEPEPKVSTTRVRTDNLTDADRKAIEEIKAEQSGKRSRKKGNSLGKVKAKSEDKANADAGGRWDARRGRWVTEAEELERVKKTQAKLTAERRKRKERSKAKNARRRVKRRPISKGSVTKKARSRTKGGNKAANS